MLTSSARKGPGRPPVRRSTATSANGVPTVVGNGTTSSAPSPTRDISVPHSDAPTPTSFSPPTTHERDMILDEVSEPPDNYGADAYSSRPLHIPTSVRVSGTPLSPPPQSLPNHVKPKSSRQSNGDSVPFSPLNGSDPVVVGPRLSLPVKRKPSSESISGPSTKVFKAAPKSPSAASGMPERRPTVITPRIEALITPSPVS